MFPFSSRAKQAENLRHVKRFMEEERARHDIEKTKAFEFVERINKLPIHKFGDYTSYLEAGSKKVWAAFRACHITAGVLVKTAFTVTGKNGRSVERLDPNLQRLMSQPNPFDSWEELIYVWTFHMKLTGNAFWLKDEVNGKGQPLNIYPLMPQHVRVIPDRYNKIAGYIYQVNGSQIELNVEDVIHFRRPSPRDSIMGIGDIEPAEALFNDQINRDIYNEKFIENGASPSGVLIKEEQVDDETAWQKFKAWWDKTYGGKRNIGKTAFLNGKWTYLQLGLSAQQMQSIEKEKLSVQNIFTAMGVPLSVAGLERASNYATAKQDDINFRKYECVPLIDILVGKLNGPQGFVKSFGPDLRIDYALSGLIDVEQVLKDYAPLFDRGGITTDQLRELCGLQRTNDPMHNTYYITAGYVPLEMAGLANPSTDELEKIVGSITGKPKTRKLDV